MPWRAGLPPRWGAEGPEDALPSVAEEAGFVFTLSLAGESLAGSAQGALVSHVGFTRP